MKFLADMGISPKTVLFLQDLNHNALHLHEQGLDRWQDSAIMKKARDENRILLTHDLDFGELIAASGDKLPSIVVFRLHNMSPENINRYISDILKRHGEMLEQGSIISVTDGQIRVRLLPVKAR